VRLLGATSAEAGPFEELLEREGLKLDYIFNTHHRANLPNSYLQPAGSCSLPGVRTVDAWCVCSWGACSTSVALSSLTR
jgi:hypothetical protein